MGKCEIRAVNIAWGVWPRVLIADSGLSVTKSNGSLEQEPKPGPIGSRGPSHGPIGLGVNNTGLVDVSGAAAPILASANARGTRRTAKAGNRCGQGVSGSRIECGEVQIAQDAPQCRAIAVYRAPNLLQQRPSCTG